MLFGALKLLCLIQEKEEEKRSAWRVFYCRSACFNNVIQYMLQPKGSEVESPLSKYREKSFNVFFFFEKLSFNACNFKIFFADHRRRVEETGGFCSTHTPRNVIFSPEVVFFSTGYYIDIWAYSVI